MTPESITGQFRLCPAAGGDAAEYLGLFFGKRRYRRIDALVQGGKVLKIGQRPGGQPRLQ
jgi:hypothetical protein